MQTRCTTPHLRLLAHLALPAALLLSGCQADLRPTAVESPAQHAAAASANAPRLIWSPGDADEGFDFEGVVVGYTTTQEFTLTNAGRSATGALTIGWAGAASFSIMQDACSRAALPPGRSCTITVEFAPEVAGYEDFVIEARGQRREALGQMMLYGEGLENRLQSSQLVAQVFGTGTDANPYTKICDWYDSSTYGNACIVIFPWRKLSALQSATVPSYKCPESGYLLQKHGFQTGTWENSDYQFLRLKRYVPGFTTVPDGVEVHGLGPIGIYIPFGISHLTFPKTAHPFQYATTGISYGIGTRTLGSSVTNWSLETRSYHVVLHCTSIEFFASMLGLV